MNVLWCLILTLAALPPAPEITGTIVDDRGKLVSGISISVVSLPSSQIIEKTLSGPGGSFSFAGLFSGGYGLEAEADSACAFSDAVRVDNGFTSIVHLRLVKGWCQTAVQFAEPGNRR
jgi:Carboxypeptidase regulatory-like domain